MSLTYYVVVPFGRSDDGNPLPLEPAETPNADVAKRRASFAAEKHGGAVAFCRIAEPATGEFGEADLIAVYGAVDLDMLGE